MATTRPVDEGSLTPEEKRAFDELLADYKAATVHVPGYTGGLARKIAVALIQAGWR
jgi:hypothetical protein